MSQIEFKRGAAFQDKIRSYKILVDGIQVGSIGDESAITVPVAPGRHSVQLKVDWCASPVIEVNMNAGITETVTCGPNSNVLLALLYITFLRKKYIWVKHVGSAA